MQEVFMIVDQRRWTHTSIDCCFLKREDAELELEKFRVEVRENSHFHSMANEEDLMDNTFITKLKVK